MVCYYCGTKKNVCREKFGLAQTRAICGSQRCGYRLQKDSDKQAKQDRKYDEWKTRAE